MEVKVSPKFPCTIQNFFICCTCLDAWVLTSFEQVQWCCMEFFHTFWLFSCKSQYSHTYNRKTHQYHCPRQLFIQSHGSGTLSVCVQMYICTPNLDLLFSWRITYLLQISSLVKHLTHSCNDPLQKTGCSNPITNFVIILPQLQFYSVQCFTTVQKTGCNQTVSLLALLDNNIKEWTSLPMPELLTMASCRQDR